jgi:hypothetical protein
MTADEWASHNVPVVEARHVRDYIVWLRFTDGVEGEADLSDLVFRRSTDWFLPLRNVEYFKRFKVTAGSIEWPNRFDVAPESLHLRVLGRYPYRKKARR